MTSNLDMTENTLQFIIKLFAGLVFIILLTVAGTYTIIVLRDGNNPLVREAFNDLVNLGQWCTITIGGIIVGKPIASGIGQFLAQKNAPTPNTDSLPPTQTTSGQSAT